MTEPTPIQVSDARLREILSGCEGVTPGPWSGGVFMVSAIDGGMGRPLTVAHTGIVGNPPSHTETDKLNAAHIRRLDPATVANIITRLLAAEASLRSAQTSPAVEVVPAGFDVTDMAMIRRGDRIGPKLGARVADALVAASSSPPSVSSEPVAFIVYAKDSDNVVLWSQRPAVAEQALAKHPGARLVPLYATRAVTDEKEGEAAELAKLVAFFSEPAAYSKWGWQGDTEQLSTVDTAIRALRQALER